MPHSPNPPVPYAGVSNSDYAPPVPITTPQIYAWPTRQNGSTQLRADQTRSGTVSYTHQPLPPLYSV